LNLREHLLKGRPIMIYDSPHRESEVDLVFYGGAIDETSIYMLRTLAGGLICFATSIEVGKALGLDFAYNYLKDIGLSKLVKRPRYGDMPAFSVWVNHIAVNTGISDEDRAKTVGALHKVVEATLRDPKKGKELFLNEFQAPGHVPVLLAKSLEERRGHTELSVRLFEKLQLLPSAVFAEMLDFGRSMTWGKARKIASTLGIPLISGDDVIELLSREKSI